jgi:lipid-A-disaccharide synthase
MEPFGDALRALLEQGPPPEVIVPAVASVRGLIEEGRNKHWPLRGHIVEGEEDKFRAFKLADAALAASGTVTLELALAGTPMAVAYRVDPFATGVRYLLKIPSVVLANLVLGENAFPEFLQQDCTGEKLAGALRPLLRNSPERDAQLAALARIPSRLMIDGPSPSEAAADIVLRYAQSGRRLPGR